MKTNETKKNTFEKFRVLRFFTLVFGVMLLIALIGTLTLFVFTNKQVPDFLALNGPVQAIVSVGGMMVSFTARGLLTGAGVFAVLFIGCIAAYCYCRMKMNQRKNSGTTETN